MIETTKNSNLIYEGKILSLYRDTILLPDGQEAIREVVKHGEAVTVLPVRDDRITLIKQYRYAVGEVLYEAVAGNINEGEDPLAAAGRELAEEAGLKAARLTRLFAGYTAPGFTSEYMYYYLAEDLSKFKLPADDDENIEVVEITIAEARSLFEQGQIKDTKTAFFIFYLLAANARA